MKTESVPIKGIGERKSRALIYGPDKRHQGGKYAHRGKLRPSRLRANPSKLKASQQRPCERQPPYIQHPTDFERLDTRCHTSKVIKSLDCTVGFMVHSSMREYENSPQSPLPGAPRRLASRSSRCLLQKSLSCHSERSEESRVEQKLKENVDPPSQANGPESWNDTKRRVFQHPWRRPSTSIPQKFTIFGTPLPQILSERKMPISNRLVNRQRETMSK
jgi:hypothetical protein